jgi:membrane-bound inhibitor of C-type lysozyme
LRYSKASLVLGFAALATSAQANVEYECFGFGEIGASATYFDEEDLIGVTRICGGCADNITILEPAISGSGSRYANDRIEFIEHQGNFYLTIDGVQGTCQVAGSVEPGGPQAGAVLAGISWGGNLREGPDINSRDVGSLAEGAPIMILQDSGIYFNGYSWFLVQTQTGQQAYQWGGIMCVPGQVVPGIYGNC